MSDMEKYRLLEHQIAVVRQDLKQLMSEVNSALNEVGTLLTSSLNINRMYQATVEQQLIDLRKFVNMPETTEQPGEGESK